jgi:hypothetical protein
MGRGLINILRSPGLLRRDVENVVLQLRGNRRVAFNNCPKSLLLNESHRRSIEVGFIPEPITTVTARTASTRFFGALWRP